MHLFFIYPLVINFTQGPSWTLLFFFTTPSKMQRYVTFLQILYDMLLYVDMFSSFKDFHLRIPHIWLIFRLVYCAPIFLCFLHCHKRSEATPSSCKYWHLLYLTKHSFTLEFFFKVLLFKVEFLTTGGTVETYLSWTWLNPALFVSRVAQDCRAKTMTFLNLLIFDIFR